jgi:hypothetical protein
MIDLIPQAVYFQALINDCDDRQAPVLFPFGAARNPKALSPLT